ncbi:DUF4065 domain-containing protein [Paenibacillus alkaliterrae]|uniref:type II toxin-antitoxin system antitoxin SocA domain-containing protein n=1 Tax=Paenibacillus alkaliterrae TaxID=320909 RepID=UPI001F185D6F|nr:type II toxin-antitoxin system antitoxin SocA domain-containing protein [Paenibacillus alkaliterrae]MCF2941827.1 DUF4065 domain-containing protein [Paenibacillus alkaliterrae]
MRYCDECGAEGPSTTIERPKTFTVRGKEIEIQQTIAVCDKGHKVYDEELDNASILLATHKYAEQYGMPAEQIHAVRQQYGIGYRPFAKIIGIGSASLRRHESGELLPSETHLDIYKRLQADPGMIHKYYQRHKGKLSTREQKQAENVLASWQASTSLTIESIQSDEEIIEAIHRPYESTELTGYLSFNLEKFIHMVLFFTRDGVAKTKLMKLLWYADFMKFKRQTVSISGAVYERLPFGPVPKDHEITLAHLQHMNVIRIEETIINDEGWTMMSVKASQQFDPSYFDVHELDILREIEYAFRNYGSRKISDYAHQERAWIETPSEHPIDYKYATDLRELDMM